LLRRSQATSTSKNKVPAFNKQIIQTLSASARVLITHIFCAFSQQPASDNGQRGERTPLACKGVAPPVHAAADSFRFVVVTMRRKEGLRGVCV
jgi:hypothetical protein